MKGESRIDKSFGFSKTITIFDRMNLSHTVETDLKCPRMKNFTKTIENSMHKFERLDSFHQEPVELLRHINSNLVIDDDYYNFSL